MIDRAWICARAERACGRAARALLSLSEVFRRAGRLDAAPEEEALPEVELPEIPPLEPMEPAAGPLPGSAAARLAATRCW